MHCGLAPGLPMQPLDQPAGGGLNGSKGWPEMPQNLVGESATRTEYCVACLVPPELHLSSLRLAYSRFLLLSTSTSNKPSKRPSTTTSAPRRCHCPQTYGADASMSPSPTTDDSESQTLSKLHLHIVPDDKPVFACHKCSEVVVSAI
jgi:hypothetical protein